MMGTRSLCWLLVIALGPGWVTLSPAAAPPSAPRFPALSSAEAWRLLPRPEPPLPAWARALAGPLPRTTAAMLQLDRLHRAGNPLGPALAARLRWTVADTLGCEYARQYAMADLRRTAVNEKEMKRLLGASADLPSADRAALHFAAKLTRAGHSVTDDEVAELIELHGAEKVVAIVHTVALANFQNRIFLALGVQVESGGPLPPLELPLDPTGGTTVPAPARPPWGQWRKMATTPSVDAVEWESRTFTELEKALDRQKGRRSRIPLPGPDRLARIPPEAKGQASRVVWTRVSMGYQPALTRAWFECMRLFQQEARLDRVFANTYFWVITRSNECFY